MPKLLRRSRVLSRGLFLWGSALALAACNEDPTAIVLAFSTELPTPSSADSLSVRFLRDGEEKFARTYDLSQLRMMPGTLVLLPSDIDDARSVVVQTRLEKRGQPSPSISRDIRLRFIKDKKPLVRVRYSLACVDKVCEPGTTCDRGQCVDPTIDAGSLPDAPPSNEEALAPPGCFDVDRCFSSSPTPPAQVTGVAFLPDGSCSFSLARAPASFNVAAAWAVAPQQLSVLEPGVDWKSDGSSVSLRPLFCEALELGRITSFYTSDACPAMAPGAVVCSPVSSGGAGGSGQGGAGSGGAGSGGAGSGGAGSGGAGSGGEAGQGGGTSGQGGAGQAGQGGSGAGGSSGAAGLGGAGQGGVGGAGAGGAGQGGVSGQGGQGGALTQIENPAKVAFGARNACAWDAQGNLACWGWASSGLLPGGQGFYEPKPRLMAGAPPVEDLGIGASDDHMCALSGGEVYCLSSRAEYCNGTGCNGGFTKINGLSGVVAQTSLTDGHCALLSSGEVRCWGSNIYGGGLTPLGAQGEAISSATKIEVAPARGVFGHEFACIISQSDEVWCWGSKAVVPAKIEGLAGAGKPVKVAIDVLGRVLVLTEAGQIYLADSALEFDSYGALLGWKQAFLRGDVSKKLSNIEVWSYAIAAIDDQGKVYTATVPQLEFKEIPLEAKAVGVAVGMDGAYYGSFCARLEAGGVWCWGGNKYGELGNGKLDSVMLPAEVKISPAGASFTASSLVSTDRNTSLISNGAVWGCGFDGGHDLRAGGVFPTLSAIGLLGSGASSISAFDPGEPYVALNGKIRLISHNSDGVLSVLDANNLFKTPVTEVIPTEHYDLALSGGQVRVLTRSIEAGADGAYGKLPAVAPAIDSVSVVSGLSKVTSLAVGLESPYRTQCALTSDGKVFCWGRNSEGQIDASDASMLLDAAEVVIPDAVAPIAQIAASQTSACARDSAGDVFCWGDNSKGQLGRGSVGSKAGPGKYAGPGGMAGVGCGRSHCCAWKQADVYCWGSNDFGESSFSGPAGAFLPLPEPTPKQLPPLPASVKALSLAGRGSTSCALLADGRVFCWGQSYQGEACNGSKGSDFAPTQVALPF